MLANKYRPQKFSDFAGQDVIINLIRQSILQSKISQSILLSGMHGVGKTSLARVIAKAINCPSISNDGEPCNQCKNCELITKGYHPDITEVDAASHTSVDNMRQIISNSQYAPMQAKYKVNIIDEAHMLSDSAFSSLLKTLEEPGRSVVFILATTKPEKIPETIISRCQRYTLNSFDAEKISTHIVHLLNKEKIQYEISAVQHIAQAAQGSMRNALLYLEQALYFDATNISDTNVKSILSIQYDSQVLQLLQQIVHNQKAEALETIRSLGSKCQPQAIVKKLWQILHRLTIMLYLSSEHLPVDCSDMNKDDCATLTAMCQEMNLLTGNRLCAIALKCFKNLDSRLSPQTALEIMVMDMISSMHIQQARSLIKQILQESKKDDSCSTCNESASIVNKVTTASTQSPLSEQPKASAPVAQKPSETIPDQPAENHPDSEIYNKIKANESLAEISRDYPDSVIEVHKKET